MKRCKVCRQPFAPHRPMQKVCSPGCAISLAKSDRAKAEKRALILSKREDRAKREGLKKLSKLKEEAQAAFNRWIRMRDADKPCISCGAPPPDMSQLHAGRDAGHYRSVGSAPHLRFNEDNVHAQCVHCNKYEAGKAVDYRIALIFRIGFERVEALESNNAVHKWTKDEVRQIRDTYRARLRNARKAICEAP